MMFPVCARNGKENADMCRCRTWLRFPRLERRGRFECVLNIYGVEYVRRTNSLFSLCFFASCMSRIKDEELQDDAEIFVKSGDAAVLRKKRSIEGLRGPFAA